jgi:hypothetical protein
MQKTKESPLPWWERLTIIKSDVCAVLSTGAPSVDRLVENGKLRRVQIGGRVVYPVEDVKRLIEPGAW